MSGEIHLQVALHGTVIHKVIARDGLALCDLLRIEVLKLIVFQFGHGLGEDLLIGLVAQVLHESALLCSQEVARPAYVEVLHGDGKTASQFREGLKGLQSAASVCREVGQGRGKEVAKRLAVGPPHASTHLV